MPRWGRRQPADPVAQMRAYEQKSLRELLDGQVRVDPLFHAVAELVAADGPAARYAVVQKNPDLAGERGTAALEMLILFAEMTQLTLITPELRELRSWLADGARAPAEPAPAGPAEKGTRAMLDSFVVAAINADQTWLRTGDADEIRQGVAIWDQMVAQDLLAGEPPVSLVDVHVTVAMLHGRLYEIDQRPESLQRAFQLLRQAAAHVIPGSDTDLLIRQHSANWIALRYTFDEDPADLDQAIDDYTELLSRYPADATDALLVMANLGRFRTLRSRVTGAEDDRRRGLELLEHAAGHLPPHHPALPHVQRMMLAARHRAP
ncbi:hypothetical protein [Actinoplanes awajinensis]|uniref:hypothetical protein n=1 Tax=Actinoplanes awajinensis TaxID=135946 RepID=UPI000AC42816|nr:hypothetical protein [Actinoplanes awajinensis]